MTRATKTVRRKLQPGVNGAVVGARDDQGRYGLRFKAPDGTYGPLHLQPGGNGFLRAWLPAVADWRAWLDRQA